jgi:hypothetical protein
VPSKKVNSGGERFKCLSSLDSPAAVERVSKARKRTFTGHRCDGTRDIAPPMSATTRLAEFTVKTTLEDCPPEAVARARLAALDTLGVIFHNAK